MKNKKYILPTVLILMALIFPELALASVESTLNAIQQKFIGTILPVLAIIGLIIAGFSFLMGNQNARQHLTLAIIGAIVGFGAPSIVSFIRGLVN
ncbi:MAG: TrbC/VirB2 family protein [Pseudobdellovibrionaceae bacterium]|nr:MAG: TrbC/VirB2 family protein [Pseudobdellovibrionaceae bacterium]